MFVWFLVVRWKRPLISFARGAQVWVFALRAFKLLAGGDDWRPPCLASLGLAWLDMVPILCGPWLHSAASVDCLLLRLLCFDKGVICPFVDWIKAARAPGPPVPCQTMQRDPASVETGSCDTSRLGETLGHGARDVNRRLKHGLRGRGPLCPYRGG